MTVFGCGFRWRFEVVVAAVAVWVGVVVMEVVVFGGEFRWRVSVAVYGGGIRGGGGGGGGDGVGVGVGIGVLVGYRRFSAVGGSF